MERVGREGMRPLAYLREKEVKGGEKKVLVINLS